MNGVSIYKKRIHAINNSEGVDLQPISSYTTHEIGGVFELELVHPIDEFGVWKSIQTDYVLKVKTYQDDLQMYRIYNITNDRSSITAKALPIWYDTNKECNMLMINSTVDGEDSINEAWERVGYTNLGKNDTKKITQYSIETDIGTKRGGPVVYAMPAARNLGSVGPKQYLKGYSPLKILIGSQSTSVINAVGGEYEFDNMTLRLMSRLGSARLLVCEFGHNMTGVKKTIDSSNITTALTVDYSGVTWSYARRPEYYSPLFNTYDIEKYDRIGVYVALESDRELMTELGIDLEPYVFYHTEGAVNAEIAAIVSQLWEAGLDKPTVSYEIQMVDLSKYQSDYNLSELYDLKLGDTIRCVDKELDIDTYSRVTKIVYDNLREEISSMSLNHSLKDMTAMVGNNNKTSIEIRNFTNQFGGLPYEQVEY